MADKKPEVTIERIYTIPLRKTWVKTRRIARAKKCIRVIKEYAMKHMHVKEVSISPKVSEEIWRSGPKKPPGKVMVKVTVAGGKASVRLPGEITLEEEKKKFLEAQKKKDAGKAPEAAKKEADAVEKAAEAKEDAKAEPPAEEKPAEAPKEEKAEKKAKPKAPKKAAAKKGKEEKK